MKLRLENSKIFFKISIDEARVLLSGETIRDEIDFGDEESIIWRARAVEEKTLSHKNLNVFIPRDFLEQEVASSRPSKHGISACDAGLSVCVQVDMRTSK